MALLLVLFIFILSATPAAAQVQLQLPELNAAEPIRITAQAANRWQAGMFDVWILRGDCVIQQGNAFARSTEAVLWIDHAPATDQRPSKVIAYLENNVEVALDVRPGATRLTDQTWFGRFFTSELVNVQVGTVAGKPDALPEVYWRGIDRRTPESAQVHQAQFTTPAAAEATPPGASPTSARRVHVYPRSDVPMQVDWRKTDPNSDQMVGVINSGVNVVIEGVNVKEMGDLGTVGISADRMVFWTVETGKPDLSGQTAQDERYPLEIYAEGNIVLRQGERIIYADRLYFDVPNRVGTVLNADVLTPAPEYAGLVRLHADMVQMTAQDRFYAQNAFFTSSRMGEPGYRLQAGDVYFEDIQLPMVDPRTGQAVIDPKTGQQAIDHQSLVTSSNNFLFVGPVPIFYWPTFSADLKDPTFYIRRAQMKQDVVYGTQVLTHWSGYELLGIRDKPVGTDLDVKLDYLNKRGFGYGGAFTYDRDDFFGYPGHVAGLTDFWGIQDEGRDNLGQGRSNLVPEKSYRYRLFWQHREMLPYDLQLSLEAGWISDRNFLEEYYKSEWEQLKDQTTGLELKQINENRSWSITADYRLNQFFTQTDWLPRADHFMIGQSVFNDAFTWYEHSNIGYAQLEKLQAPSNPNDLPFNYLPWEENTRRGERFATRQEIDWPFQVGPVKVVPYVMGEAAHWGEDINGQPLDRLWGQAGIRASMPVWSVDPTANSDFFNVHGVAHKIVFDIEFSAADASKDLSKLPLYDPINDDSVEAFQRHFLTNTFGIPSYSAMPFPAGSPWPTVGTKFDERYYALRTGLQNWVTSPSTEIADDLMAVRLGANQRWQTKRGPPDNRRIIDWITLDTNMTLYPDANRDNSGETVGLLDYNFAWHVGDRLTLVSDGLFDFFEQGQKLVSVGGFLNRPPRGSLYVGFRDLEGPMKSQVLQFSYTYLMSPKWASSFGTSIDFGAQRSYAQSFSLTRIGESLLMNFIFTVDPARGDVGVGLAVEPRFLPKGRLGNIAGAQIPPAGAFGLE